MRKTILLLFLLPTTSLASDYKSIQVYSEVNGAALAVAVSCKGAQLTPGFADEMATLLEMSKKDRDLAEAAAVSVYLSVMNKANEGGDAWCAKVLPKLANPISSGTKAPITVGAQR